MRINWFSKTSPFYRKIRRESTLYNEITILHELAEPDDKVNEHQLMDIIEQEWTELDWFRKNLFERYMVMGSLKKVSKSTTIPLTSVGRYVNSAKEEIKFNVFKKINK
jgi:hypothetical protein